MDYEWSLGLVFVIFRLELYLVFQVQPYFKVRKRLPLHQTHGHQDSGTRNIEMDSGDDSGGEGLACKHKN